MKYYSWSHTSLQTCVMYKIVCYKKSFLDLQELKSWQNKSRENPMRYWNEETPNQCLEDRFCFCSHFYYFPALWPWMSHLSLERHFLLSQVVIRTPLWFWSSSYQFPLCCLRIKCSIRARKVLWKFKVTIYAEWLLTFSSPCTFMSMRPRSWRWLQYRVVVTLTRLQAMVSFYWCSCTRAAVYPY